MASVAGAVVSMASTVKLPAKRAFHPLADLFPMMDDAALQELGDDIGANGLRDQIVTLDGAILDGRNRYRACKANRINIPRRMFRAFNAKIDGDDPLAWVISKNLKRRHLNETQRAWVASKIANLKDGQRADRVGRSIDLPTAARMLNVSDTTIKRATAVRNNKNATPQLLAAVEQGRITINLAKQAADLPADEQHEIAARAVDGDTRIVKKLVKRRAREKRERDLADKIEALPNIRVGVIYADPEWKFKTFSEDGKGATADNHYSTSALDVIKSRDVPSIAADDCVLFLWATQPMLDQALEVMEAWGFKFVSHGFWRKTGKTNQPRSGTGHWLINHHETLLIGTRGNIPCPAHGTQWPSVIKAPRGRHSEKPDVFYELIESYFPNLPKIELNARKARPGWHRWGAEAPLDEAAE